MNKGLELLLPRITRVLPHTRDSDIFKINTFHLRPPEGIGEEDLKQLKHLPKIMGDIEQFVQNQSVFP